ALLCRGAFLAGAARFLATVLPAPGEQRLAAVLLAFGMGLGVPVAIVGSLAGTHPYSGNGSYEVNSLGLLFSTAHPALAMGLTLWVVATVAGSGGEASPWMRATASV